jgi:hypothetical protein
MGIKFNRSQTFATNGTVTAAALHNLVDGLDVYQSLIRDQTSLTAVATDDKIMIDDASLSSGVAPRQTTVLNLFDDALTGGTYTNANLTGVLSLGTVTGNRSISTSAEITNGTIATALIPSGTFGTTTSTAATITVGTIPTLTSGTITGTAANITSGTVQTLTSSTLTSNLTGGTFSGSVNSTLGTIGTLNSTTGTIGNFTTTLTGDLTISTGSATVGTRVAVLNTAQQYSRAHNFAATALTVTAGTVPWNLAENQVATLTVSTTTTMNTPTNPQAGCTYVMIVTQGTGGNNTLSFSTAYKFPGGTVPVLSTGSAQVDVISFVSNGTVLFGVSSQNFS